MKVLFYSVMWALVILVWNKTSENQPALMENPSSFPVKADIDAECMSLVHF